MWTLRLISSTTRPGPRIGEDFILWNYLPRATYEQSQDIGCPSTQLDGHTVLLEQPRPEGERAELHGFSLLGSSCSLRVCPRLPTQSPFTGPGQCPMQYNPPGSVDAFPFSSKVEAIPGHSVPLNTVVTKLAAVGEKACPPRCTNSSEAEGSCKPETGTPSRMRGSQHLTAINNAQRAYCGVIPHGARAQDGLAQFISVAKALKPGRITCSPRTTPK